LVTVVNQAAPVKVYRRCSEMVMAIRETRKQCNHFEALTESVDQAVCAINTARLSKCRGTQSRYVQIRRRCMRTHPVPRKVTPEETKLVTIMQTKVRVLRTKVTKVQQAIRRIVTVLPTLPAPQQVVRRQRLVVLRTTQRKITAKITHFRKTVKRIRYVMPKREAPVLAAFTPVIAKVTRKVTHLTTKITRLQETLEDLVE